MKTFIDQLPGNSIHNPAHSTHFMWLQQVDRRITLYYQNLMVADTEDALRVIEVGNVILEPIFYVPSKDVDANFKQNAKSTHCSLKGDAIHFDYIGANNSVEISNAAWSYPDPIKIAYGLKDRIAFDKAHFSIEDAPRLLPMRHQNSVQYYNRNLQK